MTITVNLIELDEQDVAVVHGKTTQEEIAQLLGSAFGHVASTAADQGLQLAGPPFARYRAIDDTRWEIEAGFPVCGRIEAALDVEPDTLPAGTAARTLHVGTYDRVADAYQAVAAHLAARGLRQTSDPWESYLDGPDVAEPRTLLIVPCEPA